MMTTSENGGKGTVENKFPCAVRAKSVGSNSFLCQFSKCPMRNV